MEIKRRNHRLNSGENSIDQNLCKAASIVLRKKCIDLNECQKIKMAKSK